MIVISDIAGQFGALKRLLCRLPADEEIILVGDLVDRGPDSVDVIEWAMNNEKRVTTLLGNHEHMMLDYYSNTGIYSAGVWEFNGGRATMLCYERHYGKSHPPADHLEWLRARETHKFCDDGKLLVSHAPLNEYSSVGEASKFSKSIEPYSPELGISFLWNRTTPIRREFFQVFGHNSHWGLKEFKDDVGLWGICIDQSKLGHLTAFRWPSCEVFTEPYVLSKREEMKEVGI